MNLKVDNDSQEEKFMDLQYVLEEWKNGPSYPVNFKLNEGQEVYYCGHKLHPRTEKDKIPYKGNGVTKIQPDGTDDKQQRNWISNAIMKPAFVNNKDERRKE